MSTCCCRVKSGVLTDSYQPVFVIGYSRSAQKLQNCFNPVVAMSHSVPTIERRYPRSEWANTEPSGNERITMHRRFAWKQKQSK